MSGVIAYGPANTVAQARNQAENHKIGNIITSTTNDTSYISSIQGRGFDEVIVELNERIKRLEKLVKV